MAAINPLAAGWLSPAPRTRQLLRSERGCIRWWRRRLRWRRRVAASGGPALAMALSATALSDDAFGRSAWRRTVAALATLRTGIQARNRQPRGRCRSPSGRTDPTASIQWPRASGSPTDGGEPTTRATGTAVRCSMVARRTRREVQSRAPRESVVGSGAIEPAADGSRCDLRGKATAPPHRPLDFVGSIHDAVAARVTASCCVPVDAQRCA